MVEPGHIKMAGALPFTKVKAVAHLKIHNPALIPPSPNLSRTTR
ncbi:glutamine amidotransferase yafJ domain protein [Shigella flexneri]|nr:glutamine amidotransferase yafJ domain protein [Shigella flexneri]